MLLKKSRFMTHKMKEDIIKKITIITIRISLIMTNNIQIQTMATKGEEEVVIMGQGVEAEEEAIIISTKIMNNLKKISKNRPR